MSYFNRRVIVLTEATGDDVSTEPTFSVVASFHKPEEAYKWLKEEARDSIYHVAGMIRADIQVERVTVPKSSVSSGTGFVTRAPRDPSKPRKPRAKKTPKVA